MPSGVNEGTKAEGRSDFSAARISPDIILPNNIKKGNPVISVMLCDVDNKAKLGFISFFSCMRISASHTVIESIIKMKDKSQ